MSNKESLKSYVLNKGGRFGEFGGRYVPELLMPIMEELEADFYKAIEGEQFLKDLKDLYENYAGRPTPLYHCENLSKQLGGA